jgi:hypothetical protein
MIHVSHERLQGSIFEEIEKVLLIIGEIALATWPGLRPRLATPPF